MISSEDRRLDGVNDPEAKYTWVVGDDPHALDHDIKKLRSMHGYKDIASILNVPEHLIARRVRHLIKSGEIHSKHESGRTGGRVHDRA
jgi:hypothetical protein